MLRATVDFVLRSVDHGVLRADDLVLRSKLYRGLRSDLHGRLRARVHLVLCAELYIVLLARLHHGILRGLVSRLLVKPSQCTLVGFAIDVRRLLRTGVHRCVCTFLFSRLRAGLFDLRLVRPKHMFKLHGWLCSSVQHLRIKLRNFVRSSLFVVQQLRHAASHASPCLRLRYLWFDLRIGLRLLGPSACRSGFLPSSCDHLSATSNRLLELLGERTARSANTRPSSECSSTPDSSPVDLRPPTAAAATYPRGRSTGRCRTAPHIAGSATDIREPPGRRHPKHSATGTGLRLEESQPVRCEEERR